ncbi:twin-arginine translocase subunit TatC [Halopelagius longus]|uniref:Sec-independent protein translocase protein TatC n=1 Tax=Halopelagius longus TaxID=1236180 RepID=A0A1H1ED19_9EURY|nr:twin-arginine translocase subunit TatC [Halopelagius longus]RDI71685.1 MFS transporter [Halopelagius longus]SDQ86056.1 sec-independent protein translocase protein TatC [Halopelagius longus]
MADESETDEGSPPDELASESGGDPAKSDEAVPETDTESDGDADVGSDAPADADSDSDAPADTHSDSDAPADADGDRSPEVAYTPDDADDPAPDAEDPAPNADDTTDADTDLWPEAEYTPDDADDPAPDAEEAEYTPDDADDPAPDVGETDADAGAVETGTDGGEVPSSNAPTRQQRSETEYVDDGIVGEGPESDEEMPLADHIEEMVRRLAVVFAVGGIVTLILFPGGELVNSAFGFNLTSATEVINYLWNRHIPGAPEIAKRRPRVYGPLELVLTELKVAGLAGLLVGLPVFVYETYLFMRPGLYKRERRYYLAAVPTSLVLALVGMAFAHFVVLPAIFAYFTSYTTGTATVAFGLKETFNLILLLMGYMAIVFQIPLFVMLAIMMNLVTRDWLIQRRLLFWGAFLGLSFLVSPDPTGMAPIIIAATMITLFEGTLFLLRWTRME